MTIPLVALRRPVKLLVYLCPSTPVAIPRPDAPVALQEGAWDAVKTDELDRSWWQPDDAVRVMYRHLDPELAAWAAGQLRHDADPGPYPLEGTAEASVSVRLHNRGRVLHARVSPMGGPQRVRRRTNRDGRWPLPDAREARRTRGPARGGPDLTSPLATSSARRRFSQRVGVGIFRWSPAWIGIVRPGFMSSIRLYDTPNQLAMLWRLSPARIT
jgi:hypothetical protein